MTTDKIENNLMWQLIVTTLFLFLLVVVTPYLIISAILTQNHLLINNSTKYIDNNDLAGMYVNLISGLLMAFLTFMYVILTGNLVKQSKKSIAVSNEAIIQSKEANILSKEEITQSKKEHEIMYIQMRLEKLYYPLKIILNSYKISDKSPLSTETIPLLKAELNKLLPYLYLASESLSPILNDFIDLIYRNGVLIEDEVTKALDEHIQNEGQTEEVVENAKLHKLVGKIFTPEQWETLLNKKIVRASTLYLSILKTIDTDIEYYKNMLKERTTI
ncbi:hypothetical protein RG963_10175 [Methanosarcina sp. Z-7115]|uniref:Phage abortive infection protein n=1 Tax=Methanosarcina baikalica TaxID=3073890 RepID=A0ABU2D2R0_9EURY|nr:hypothetical protein [Methanosarcina sp. Z-7115]MDR7666132.1 hypothetical protein [Methanosarcina sp. Z-7115]